MPGSLRSTEVSGVTRVLLKTKTWDWLVIVIFAFLTLAITYPLPLRLTTHLAGDDYDVWARPWATWWTKMAIRGGRSLYYSDMLFYPRGVSLVYHSFSHVNTAIALLLEPLVGYVAAHNVTVLLAYLLSGFSMYLLARYLTGSVGAGFVAGLVFTFSTYHIDQSSHLIILTTQWIPLWILAVIRLFHEPYPLRHALLAALFLALTALSSWHLLLFSVLWLGFYLVYLLIWERERITWPTLRALGLMGAVTLILIGPLFFPLVVGQLEGTARKWVETPSSGENALDVLAPFVPSRWHPVLGPLVEPLHQRIGRRQVFLGYTALVLALAGAIKYWRQARFWALSTLAFFLMSLGAYIRFDGIVSKQPLQPWLLPLTRLIRDPARLMVMTTLGLALLAALGVGWLVQKVRRSMRTWLVVGLSGLVLFEYLPWPFPTTPVNIPTFYEQLQRDTDFYAIADIPVRQLELRRLSMFYQIVHRKPILEGIVARTPLDAYAFIDQHPILSAFTGGGQEPPGDDVSRRLGALADANVRYLILHRHFLTAPQVEQWQLYLPYAPYYQDDRIIVYRTRPVLGEDLTVPLLIGNGMGLAYTRLDTRYPHPGEPLPLQVAWVAVQSPIHSYRVRWMLIDRNGDVARVVEGQPCPGWPTDVWQAGDFGLGRYELPADLSPGPYRLQVQMVDEQGTIAARDVNSVLVLPTEEAVPTAVSAAPVATFGNQIALTSVRLLQGDQMLHLQFDWLALQKIDRDYKLFVHLLADEGRLVNQLDTLPRDWSAPTSTWRKGEAVSDLVSLDTYGLPAGTYTLSMGLYDALSQERLPLLLPNGSLAPDATLQQEIHLP